MIIKLRQQNRSVKLEFGSGGYKVLQGSTDHAFGLNLIFAFKVRNAGNFMLQNAITDEMLTIKADKNVDKLKTKSEFGHFISK